MSIARKGLRSRFVMTQLTAPGSTTAISTDGTKYTYNSGKIDASGKIYISGYYLTYL